MEFTPRSRREVGRYSAFCAHHCADDGQRLLHAPGLGAEGRQFAKKHGPVGLEGLLTGAVGQDVMQENVPWNLPGHALPGQERVLQVLAQIRLVHGQSVRQRQVFEQKKGGAPLLRVFGIGLRKGGMFGRLGIGRGRYGDEGAFGIRGRLARGATPQEDEEQDANFWEVAGIHLSSVAAERSNCPESGENIFRPSSIMTRIYMTALRGVGSRDY
jgi:hypothetical protein